MAESIDEPNLSGDVVQFVRSLADRASDLELAAEACDHQKLSVVAQIDWAGVDDGPLDDWLRDRVHAFEELQQPERHAAMHFSLVLGTANGTTLDANMVCFPTLEPLVRPKWLSRHELGELEAARAEASCRPHKALEVAMWGSLSEQPFTLAGSHERAADTGGADIGLMQVPTSELNARRRFYFERDRDAHQEEDARLHREADLARSPEDLRAWLYGADAELHGTGLDTSLPEGEGAAWALWAMQGLPVLAARREKAVVSKQSFYGEEANLVLNDVCTEEQLRIFDARQKDPTFWQLERIKDRARRRRVSLAFQQAAPDMLEHDRAQEQWAKQRRADEQGAISNYEQRAEEGACVTQWPMEGRWPQMSWPPRVERLAASSLDRAKKVRRSPQPSNFKPQLNVHLINAVARGDFRKVQHLLKQGWIPILKSPDIFLKACALKQGGRQVSLYVDKREEVGQELSIYMMNGSQLTLVVDPMCTVKDVLQRVQSDNSSDSEHLKHAARLSTLSGVLLRDATRPLSDVFADEDQWVLTLVMLAQGSMLAADMFIELRDALCSVSSNSWQQLITSHGVDFLEEAAKVGNTLIVQLLLDSGVELVSALSRICRNCFHRGTVAPDEIATYQASLEILISSFSQSGFENPRQRFPFNPSQLKELLEPILKEMLITLPEDHKLWLSLARVVGSEAIGGLLPNSLLASMSFVIELTSTLSDWTPRGRKRFLAALPDSLFASKRFAFQMIETLKDWTVLCRVGPDLQMDEELLLTAMRLDKKAADAVPNKAWTHKLAWLALEKGFCPPLRYMPADVWTLEFALRAVETHNQFALSDVCIDAIPAHIWGQELALALVRKGYSTHRVLDRARLPAEAWTQDFALRVLNNPLGIGGSADAVIDVIPAHAWGEELILKLVSKGASMCSLIEALQRDCCLTSDLVLKLIGKGASREAVLEVLPDDFWSEEFAFELIGTSARAAAVIPPNMWTKPFVHKLARKCWQAVVHAPLELRQEDQELSDILLKNLQDSTKEFSGVPTDLRAMGTKLLQHRALLQLGEVLAEKPLFKKDLLRSTSDVSVAAIALRLQLVKLDLLRTGISAEQVCASPEALRDVLKISKTKLVDLAKQRYPWKQKTPPDACVVLLYAVRCLLNYSLLAETPCDSWEASCAAMKNSDAFVSKIARFEVSALPRDVATAVSKLVYFLHAGSARTTTLWALENHSHTTTLASLASWVQGVLHFSLRDERPPMASFTNPCEMHALQNQLARMKDEAQVLRKQLDGDDDARLMWCYETCKTVTVQGDEPLQCCGINDDTDTDLRSLEDKLREKLAIVDAMRLLEDRLFRLSKTRKAMLDVTVQEEIWEKTIYESYEKILDEAKILLRKEQAAVDACRERLSALLQRDGSNAIDKMKDETEIHSPSHALGQTDGFGANRSVAIVSDARKFLESSCASWPSRKVRTNMSKTLPPLTNHGICAARSRRFLNMENQYMFNRTV